jgi:thiol-disulfide isomerase/thioredoxin
MVAAAVTSACAPSFAVMTPEKVTLPSQTRLLNGDIKTANEWAGQGLLVVFWATHCPFCHRHNAKLQQVMATLGPQAPRVLAVSLDRDAAAVERYLRGAPLPFMVTLDSAAWLSALRVKRVMPTTVPINRFGQRGLVVPGEMFEEDLAELAHWAQQGLPTGGP